MKQTVCVDFDGVIHSYTSQWEAPHIIPDPPVPGAISALVNYLDRGFEVIICTTRARTWRGRRAVKRWLRLHSGTHWFDIDPPFAPIQPGIESIRVTDRKPAALIYIDDRAFRFDGTFWPTPEQIHRKPWNKGGSNA